MPALANVSVTLKYTIGVVTLLVGIGVITICLTEVYHWRSGRTMIDKVQLGLRLAGAGLLLTILGMIFFGVFFAEILSRPMVFLSFWSVCMALAVALLVIAVIDLRRLARKQETRQKELYREFANIIRQEAAKLHGQSGGVEGPEGESPAEPQS